MIQKTLTRLLAVFVAAAIPNVLVGQLVDVDVWQAAIMSGAIAVLGVVQQLAVTYRNDGELTEEDVNAAINKGA
jgi:hypothetical protein